METILQDVRHALRVLRREPAFVCTALLSLALGIGANTAIFTVTKTVFGNVLPVRDVSRLLEVYWLDNATSRTIDTPRLNVSYLNFRDLRERSGVFTDAACFTEWMLTLTGLPDGRPRPMQATLASANYFEVLGVRASLGRTFVAGEDTHPGGDRVAVLSHRAWTSLFAADPSAIGRRVVLNDVAYTVIGVAAPGFRGTLTLGDPEQIWIPISMLNEVADDPKALATRRSRQSRVFGRLKPGVDEIRALAGLKVLASDLEKAYPWENANSTFDVAPLADAALDSLPTANGMRIATALSLVVALILLIACLNVANLLIVRATARSREVAVRAAIGASAARLARQFVVEGAVLAAGGGILGLMFGVLGARLLWSLRPDYLSRSGLELRFDWQVLLFTAGVALLTNLIFGLGPALVAASPNLTQLMNSGSRGAGPAAAGRRLRHVLVASQVAVAFIALVFAGLLVRSLQHAQRVDLGFDSAHVGVVRFDLKTRKRSPGQMIQLSQSIVDAAAQVPAIASVALASNIPLSGAGRRTVLSEEQLGDSSVVGTATALNYVSHDYFRTMKMRAIEGRLFDGHDRAGARRVAVVNEAMAKYFWPGRSPIGRKFLLRSIAGVRHEVVGVVPNSVLGELNESPQPIGYIPLEQDPKTWVALHIRAESDPARVLPAAMEKVRTVDPDLAFINPATIEQMLAERLWAWRAGASLFGLFAVMGLVLASVGIFGAMSHTIVQRTNEIGIRIALGASPSKMRMSLLRDGMTIVGIGIALGAIVAFALTAFIRSLIFGIAPTDSVTFASTTWVFATVAAFACWLAGRRVLRIDPIRAINQG